MARESVPNIDKTHYVRAETMAKSLIYNLPRALSGSSEDEPAHPAPTRPDDLIQTSGSEVNSLDRQTGTIAAIKN